MALRGLVGALVAVLVRLEGRRRGPHGPSATLSERWGAAGASSSRQLLDGDGVDDTTRARLATAWQDSARAAHDSLAASAKRALQLATLGAPPELVTSAHEDALDRIRLVKIGFALARGIDGRAGRLSELRAPAAGLVRAPRPMALARLATDVVIDLAFAGAVWGRIDAKLARRTTDGDIREALEETASLKARQIGRAWAIVAWCLDEEPNIVGRALEVVGQRLHQLPVVARDVPQEALEGGWERWGIAGRALENQERLRALDTTSRKLNELVGARATTSFRHLAA
ncbi:MAG: hypothetical protein K0S65_1626 [Labilithrix sp.]|nr:hypothetical protein [Labilithrix sp.]